MSARPSNMKYSSNEARLLKNKRIKEAGMVTRDRRNSMNVKVYELKIVESKLNLIQKQALKEIFLEYKWLRNAALAAERFDLDFTKELRGIVPVNTPTGLDHRKIRWLGSQMQQAVITELKRNLKSLSALKKNGRRVGKLKFIRNANSIDLQQYKKTYELYSTAEGRITKVRVQNIPGRLRVRGGEQLSREHIEYANAKLIRKASGYYLQVTTYTQTGEAATLTSSLGVDFGIKNSFTLSTGEAVTALVEESEKLRQLQRRLTKQMKNSNSYGRTQLKIRREYEKINNKKDEIARQLVSTWTTNNVVYFQDEVLSSWKKRDSGSRGSRKVHHGILGRVKSLLKSKPNTVMLPAWVATTAWCPSCGNRTKQELSKRIYKCACGYTEERDSHAAKNMILLGERYKTLTSGTEGSASGASIRLEEALYAPVEQLAVKLETA